MGFRDQTGGFDLRLANECEATKCSGILQERSSEQFARIVVEVDPAEPHVIKSIELHPIPHPAEFPIPRMTEAEALKAFRADLDGTAAADRFSGAALVARNGKPVFSAGWESSFRGQPCRKLRLR
jgi:D-alanyl-D-alanine carboxypeptidase